MKTSPNKDIFYQNRRWFPAILLLTLILFYLPFVPLGDIVFDDGSVVPNHLAFVQGDARYEGRFLPYFSVGGNYRPWSDDTTFNPLHLLRLLTIITGSSLFSWAFIMVLIHVSYFFVVFHYSRKAFNVPMSSAFFGGLVSYFTINWGNNCRLITGITCLPLIFAAVFEYYLFLKTGKKRHVIFCIIANSLQPYFCDLGWVPSALLTFLVLITLIHVLGRDKYIFNIKPLLFIGVSVFFSWVIICAPAIAGLLSGDISRFLPGSARQELAFSLSSILDIFSLLIPFWESFMNSSLFQAVIPGINIKNWYWCSIFFIPSVLILRGSNKSEHQLIYKLIIYYIIALVVSRSVRLPGFVIPSIIAMDYGILSLLSGLALALVLDKIVTHDGMLSELKIVNRIYSVIFIMACFLVPFLVPNVGTYYEVFEKYGISPSRPLISFMINAAKLYLLSFILCVLFYKIVAGKQNVIKKVIPNKHTRMILKYIAVFLAIALPNWAINYGTFGHIMANYGNMVIGEDKSPLEFYFKTTKEQTFIQDVASNHRYRVGFYADNPTKLFTQKTGKSEKIKAYASYSYVAPFWGSSSQLLRDGIAYAYPMHHFLPSYLEKMFLETNVIKRDGKIVGNQRWFLITPDNSLLNDYGVKFVVSNIDIRKSFPKYKLVFEGEYVSVFENETALPVAYFSDAKDRPLKLFSTFKGFYIPIQEVAGNMRISMNLRNMKISCLLKDGSQINITPTRLTETTWNLDIPPDVQKIVFAARGFDIYAFFVIICFSLFIVCLIFVGKVAKFRSSCRLDVRTESQCAAS